MSAEHLSEIKPGDKAFVLSYFGNPLPELDTGTVVKLENTIAPPDNPDFPQDKFYARFPGADGKLLVFSASMDTEGWYPPEFGDLGEYPYSTYYPKRAYVEHMTAATRAIPELEWFRTIEVGVAKVDGFKADEAQLQVLEHLLPSFSAQGHIVGETPSGSTDLILLPYTIPTDNDGASLYDSIEEVEPMAAVAVRDNYNLATLPPNLVVVTTITEDLRSFPHIEVEDIARMASARIGSFKMLFVKVNPDTGVPEYCVFTTPEGGHATIEIPEDISATDWTQDLRDRLVTHACAKEVGGYTSVTDAISSEDWSNCATVEALRSLGRQLGELGHFDPPVDVSLWVTPGRAKQIEALLGWLRQSPGAVIAFAPDLELPEEYRHEVLTGTPIVSCTGRHDVDKTNMGPDELVAVMLKDGELHAFGVESQQLKGPSIEGDELVGGMLASPMVRLSEHPEGDGYIYDPEGNIVVPYIWGVVHTHRAVEEARPIRVNGHRAHVVEHIPPNTDKFPYAVGCGKDMMFEISRDGMERAGASFDPTADADVHPVVGMFDVANHGTNFFLYCAPMPGTDKIPKDPFENFLKLLDPNTLNCLELTTEIPQM